MNIKCSATIYDSVLFDEVAIVRFLCLSSNIANVKFAVGDGSCILLEDLSVLDVENWLSRMRNVSVLFFGCLYS